MKGEVRHGEGSFTSQNGDHQKGEWQENVFWVGEQRLTHENGEVYDGKIQNGRRNGDGVLTYPDGTVDQGTWVDGELPMTLRTYKNGDKYEGSLKSGLKDGQGTHFFSNGDTYEGMFSEDKRHGSGKFVSIHGMEFEGQWADDKFVRS